MTCLVHAASGGIGQILIQLAKRTGERVRDHEYERKSRSSGLPLRRVLPAAGDREQRLAVAFQLACTNPRYAAQIFQCLRLGSGD